MITAVRARVSAPIVFTDPWAARVLRHPVPLALEFVSLVYHGVLDR